MARTARYTVRLPQPDLERVKASARAAGRSLPDFIRRRLLGGDQPLDVAPVQVLVLTAAHRALAGQLTDGEREALGQLERAIATVRERQGAGAAIDELIAAGAERGGADQPAASR